MILQRSFADAILDSLSQGLISNIVWLIIVVASLFILKLRFPVPKKTVVTAIVCVVGIPIIVPYDIVSILVLIAGVVIVVGIILLFTGIAKKLSRSYEWILDITQFASIVVSTLLALGLIVGITNAGVALAGGAKSNPAQLVSKSEYPAKDRVLLTFLVSGDGSKRGFTDVWLPISNSPAFTEKNCYQLEYYKSPFLIVEGRSEVYVTSIQNQGCK